MLDQHTLCATTQCENCAYNNKYMLLASKVCITRFLIILRYVSMIVHVVVNLVLYCWHIENDVLRKVSLQVSVDTVLRKKCLYNVDIVEFSTIKQVKTIALIPLKHNAKKQLWIFTCLIEFNYQHSLSQVDSLGCGKGICKAIQIGHN